MKIIPIFNLPIMDIPNANFLIQWATDEKIIIYRIELDASHCNKLSAQKEKSIVWLHQTYTVNCQKGVT
jgi:hypothetical protein